MARYPDATSCIGVVFSGARFVAGFRHRSFDAFDNLDGCLALFGVSLVSCRAGH